MAATIPTNGIVLNSGLDVADGDITLANGHGVSFAATADAGDSDGRAEILNDYEEGSFSVTVGDATSGGNSNAMTHSGEVDGVYTKVGDTVFFSIAGTLNTTGLTGTNGIYLRGLPLLQTIELIFMNSALLE